MENILCSRCKCPQASLNGEQIGKVLLESRRQCIIGVKGRVGSKSSMTSQSTHVQNGNNISMSYGGGSCKIIRLQQVAWHTITVP